MALHAVIESPSSLGIAALSSNILCLAMFHNPSCAMMPPSSNYSLNLLPSFTVTLSSSPSTFNPLPFQSGTSPISSLRTLFNSGPYALSRPSFPVSLVAGSPWPPEISSSLFSLRSGHPDFTYPTNCRKEWRRGSKIKVKSNNFRAPCDQKCPLLQNFITNQHIFPCCTLTHTTDLMAYAYTTSHISLKTNEFSSLLTTWYSSFSIHLLPIPQNCGHF